MTKDGLRLKTQKEAELTSTGKGINRPILLILVEPPNSRVSAALESDRGGWEVLEVPGGLPWSSLMVSPLPRHDGDGA